MAQVFPWTERTLDCMQIRRWLLVVSFVGVWVNGFEGLSGDEEMAYYARPPPPQKAGKFIAEVRTDAFVFVEEKISVDTMNHQRWLAAAHR